MMFRDYIIYRELSGKESFDLPYREIRLRLEAQKDIRQDFRNDVYRASFAAGLEIHREDAADAHKVIL